MSGYIGNIPVPQATQHRESFTATSGQTSFATAGYTPQFLDVYLNGIHLVNGDDYTATNGSDVVLTTGAATDDVLEVVSYTPFEVADQTFTGTTTVSDLQSTTADFSGAVTGTNLTLSGGVYLGGTGAANLLDDYEEGTWTPTAPTGWTIASQYTYYVKVGNLVTVKAKIFIDGESTGAFYVSGLPFTGRTGLAQMAGPVMYEQISFSGAGDVVSFVESGVSRLDFWYMSSSGGAWTQWTSTETTTNTEIYVDATYVAA
jgi:hypothetical protein